MGTGRIECCRKSEGDRAGGRQVDLSRPPCKNTPPDLSDRPAKRRAYLYENAGLPIHCTGRLLVLAGYFDESQVGLAGRSILVLGGYLAPVEKWLGFSEQWNAILQKNSLTHFHAKDLPNGHSKLYRNLSFRAREQLVEELTQVIIDHVDMGIAVMMSPDDWNACTTDVFRSQHGSAYGICMQLLLLLASAILMKPEGQEPERVDVFLEDGHANADDAILRVGYYKDDTEPVEILSGAQIRHRPEISPGEYIQIPEQTPFRTRFMRIGQRGLAPKVATKPVQAADLFAYLTSNLLRPAGRAIFSAFNRLGRQKPHWLSVWPAGKVNVLAHLIEQGEKLAAHGRETRWRLSRALRSLGLKVHMTRGSFVVDARDFEGWSWNEEWDKLLALPDEPTTFPQ